MSCGCENPCVRSLLSPPDTSDFYRGDAPEPPPDYARDIGISPDLGTLSRGQIPYDQHLARYFARRLVVARSFAAEWVFPVDEVTTDLDQLTAGGDLVWERRIPLHPAADFIVTGVRWDWSGFPHIQVGQTGELDGLASPVVLDWGTDADRVSDGPRAIAALFGCRHNWAPLPRTVFFDRARVLKFLAGVDWTSWIIPGFTIPATTLNVLVDGFELYPEGYSK